MGRINISSVKKLRRDLCRTVGHEWVDLKPNKLGLPNNQQCSRCKEKVWSAWGSRVVLPTFELKPKVRVKYSDITTRKFNILDRAKKRASDGDKT